VTSVDEDCELVASWIRHDSLRWDLLTTVTSLGLPDCWIAAGFVRDAVWSILHEREPELAGDIDVIWFDPGAASEDLDRSLEQVLRERKPGFAWSVKNQGRMHLRNGDATYRSSEDAMRFWPETATAVAVRRAGDACEIVAPFGLRDLLELRLVPAGAFAGCKRAIFDARVASKRWTQRFPRLTLGT
jgi:hypothetical protein